MSSSFIATAILVTLADPAIKPVEPLSAHTGPPMAFNVNDDGILVPSPEGVKAFADALSEKTSENQSAELTVKTGIYYRGTAETCWSVYHSVELPGHKFSYRWYRDSDGEIDFDCSYDRRDLDERVTFTIRILTIVDPKVKRVHGKKRARIYDCRGSVRTHTSYTKFERATNWPEFLAANQHLFEEIIWPELERAGISLPPISKPAAGVQ